MYLLPQVLSVLLFLEGIWAEKESALLPLVFDPIPLGSIRPVGWMKEQLQLMADGLPGHQYDFYRYVKDSSWVGGDQEYSTLNEAWPYWFNGIVPLAYSLDDDRLKAQVKSSIDYIFENQQSDGWIGPETTPQTRMFWPRTLVLMAITQYLEAEPTEAARLLPPLYKYMELSREMLADNLLGYIGREDSKFDYHWGITRSQDMLIPLQWLYDNYPEGNEQLLLDIMKYFNDAAWDWAHFYSKDVFPKKDLDLEPPPDEDLFWYYHGVNSAMGLKALAVVRRLTHNASLVDISRRGYAWTFNYHGSPSGTIIGDEPWSGLSPTRGSELCTTVEAMYSLGYLYRAFGDKNYADHAERAAYNALPAAVSADYWSHQYVTQINQPFSQNLTESPFNNVNSMGNTFGLEPDYPCCTVNHPQGFPKFLASSYVKFGPNGIAQAAIVPSELTTTLQDGTNEVTIKLETIYPFGHDLYYTITAIKPFSFYLRVPKWAVHNTTSIDLSSSSDPPSLHCIPIEPEAWSGLQKIDLPAGTSSLNYTIGAKISITPRAGDTVTITYGALLYAIDAGGNTTSTTPRSSKGAEIPEKYTHPSSHDHSIVPTAPWQVMVDPSTISLYTKNGYHPLNNPVYTSNGPPVSMQLKGCEIEWDLEKGTAKDPPPKGERVCTGEWYNVKLVPYGSAKLHMAQLPTGDFRASLPEGWKDDL